MLDGFPRTSAQADALDEMLEEIGRGLDIVFEFQLPDDIATERLTSVPELEGRADDAPDAIAKRSPLPRADGAARRPLRLGQSCGHPRQPPDQRGLFGGPRGLPLPASSSRPPSSADGGAIARPSSITWKGHT